MLSDEVVRSLAGPETVLIDATVGDGGHAAALLAASGPTSRLLGIDLDATVLRVAQGLLAPFGERVRLVHGTFADLARIVGEEGFGHPTGILFDLGLHSAQLDAERGFSFRSSSVLDMRFDPMGVIALPEPAHPALRRLAKTRPAYTAADVLRVLPGDALAELLSRYGDERWAPRIANAIVKTRARTPIRTTGELVSVIVRALPGPARHGRLHAATKSFQALRIAVNRERESLGQGLGAALRLVARGGRIAVIAYHSGEDRIVKRRFREAAAGGDFTLITKHPITPSTEERVENSRSRSARLRILEHQISS